MTKQEITELFLLREKIVNGPSLTPAERARAIVLEKKARAAGLRIGTTPNLYEPPKEK